MDAELVPKPLLFSHLALLVPFMVKYSPWGMLGLALPNFGSCWEGQKSKTFKCIWGGSTAPLSCTKLLQAYLLDVPHSENLYFSVHQIGTVLIYLFLWNTCSHVLVGGKKAFFNLCQGSAQKQQHEIKTMQQVRLCIYEILPIYLSQMTERKKTISIVLSLCWCVIFNL